jgi:hypothetical protein
LRRPYSGHQSDDADAVAAAKNPLIPSLSRPSASAVLSVLLPVYVSVASVLPAATAIAAVSSGIEKTGLTVGAGLFGYGLIAVGAVHARSSCDMISADCGKFWKPT